jgi:hypothetical protein
MTASESSLGFRKVPAAMPTANRAISTTIRRVEQKNLQARSMKSCRLVAGIYAMSLARSCDGSAKGAGRAAAPEAATEAAPCAPGPVKPLLTNHSRWGAQGAPVATS